MQHSIFYSCISHIGHVRKNNQDNFICNGRYIDNNNLKFPISGCVKSTPPILFGVFDGMGGEECGEIASLIATKSAATLPITKDGVSYLSKLCKHANNEICKYAKTNNISAMGTTAALLFFYKNKITLCNIGDSKVFRFSGNDLEQISKDHVTVSVFGKKPPLSQNLGIPPDLLVIEPYLSLGRCKNGDKYLICSDGLTDMLSTDEIKAVLKKYESEKAATVLVNSALKNGGKDNITAILIELQKSKNKITNIFKKDIGGINL